MLGSPALSQRLYPRKEVTVEQIEKLLLDYPEELDLSNSKLTSRHTIPILKHFNKPNQLRVLDLSNNQLTGDDCERFIIALSDRSYVVIRDLNISGNSITEPVLNEIKSLISRNADEGNSSIETIKTGYQGSFSFEIGQDAVIHSSLTDIDLPWLQREVEAKRKMKQGNGLTLDQLLALIKEKPLPEGVLERVEEIRTNDQHWLAKRTEIDEFLRSSLPRASKEILRLINARNKSLSGLTAVEMESLLKEASLPYRKLSVDDNILTLDIEGKRKNKNIVTLLLSLSHYGITGLKYIDNKGNSGLRQSSPYLRLINNNLTGLKLIEITAPLNDTHNTQGSVTGLLIRNQEIETLKLTNIDMTFYTVVSLDEKDDTRFFPLLLYQYPNLTTLAYFLDPIRDYRKTFTSFLKLDRLRSLEVDPTKKEMEVIANLSNLKELTLGTGSSGYQQGNIFEPDLINQLLKRAPGVKINIIDNHRYTFNNFQGISKLEKLDYLSISTSYNRLNMRNAILLDKAKYIDLRLGETYNLNPTEKRVEFFFDRVKNLKRLRLNVPYNNHDRGGFDYREQIERATKLFSEISTGLKVGPAVTDLTINDPREKTISKEMNVSIIRLILNLLDKQSLETITMKNLTYRIMHFIIEDKKAFQKYRNSAIFFELINGYTNTPAVIERVDQELDPIRQDTRIMRNRQTGLRLILARMIANDPALRAEAARDLPPIIKQQFQD